VTGEQLAEAARRQEEETHEAASRVIQLPRRLLAYARDTQREDWRAMWVLLRQGPATAAQERKARAYLSDLEVYPQQCLRARRICPPAQVVWMAPHMQTEGTDEEAYKREYYWELKKYHSWLEQVAIHTAYLDLLRTAWPMLRSQNCTWYQTGWLAGQFHTCHFCRRTAKFRDEILQPFLKTLHLDWVKARARDDIVGAMHDGMWPPLLRGAMLRLVALAVELWFGSMAPEVDYQPSLQQVTLRDVLFKDHWTELGDVNAYCKRWLDQHAANHLFPLADAADSATGERSTEIRLDAAPFPWPGALDTGFLFRDISLNGDAGSAEQELRLNLPIEWQRLAVTELTHGQWTVFLRLVWRHQRHVQRTPLLEFLRTVVFFRAIGRSLWTLNDDNAPPQNIPFETFDGNQMSFDEERVDLTDDYLTGIEIMLAHWTHTLLMEQTFARNTAISLFPDRKGGSYAPDRLQRAGPAAERTLAALLADPARFIPSERECVQWALDLYRVVKANRATQREKGGCSSDPLLEGIQAVGLGYFLKPGDVAAYIGSKGTSVQRVHFEILRDRQPDAWATILLLDYHAHLLEYTILRATPLTQTMNTESTDPVVRQAQARVVSMFKELQTNATLMRELEPEANAVVLRRAYQQFLPAIFAAIAKFEELRTSARTNSITIHDLQSNVDSSRTGAGLASVLQKLEKLTLEEVNDAGAVAQRRAAVVASERARPMVGEVPILPQDPVDTALAVHRGFMRDILEADTPAVRARRLIEQELSSASSFATAPEHAFTRDFFVAHYGLRCYGQMTEIDEQKHFRRLRGAASPIAFVDICHPRERVPSSRKVINPGLVRAASTNPDQSFLLAMDGEYWLRWGPFFCITRQLQVALRLRAALAQHCPLGPSGQFNPVWVDPITRGFAPWRPMAT